MAYFTTLYSGSSGNCGLVRCGDQYLLIDMGKSCRTTLTALKSLGLAVSDCAGILITHEHSDHVAGLDTFLNGHVMALATDLGYLTPVVQDNLIGCDLVALEANYDAFSLHGGPYPYYLKQRIASDRGHLDNRACAAEILDLIQEGCKKFALCHLSQTNNSPELALTTVYNVLLAAGIQPGRDVLIQAQERNDISPYIEF